ncbi:hypothetical protein [Streptomyces sp. NBC_01471]|uniref:hypothetical protein n=1 Tax=Streptomyces sp. NBC_01471 TaxID=2903879 RepID=UPI00352C73E6
MRNPVGPLPSSIYWRRRAVAATLVALLALLVVWMVTSGSGGKHGSPGAKGAGPAPSITPGPSGSGPAISQAPGGSGGSGDSGGSGSSSGSDAGQGSGSGGSDGDGSGSGGTGSGGGGANGSGGSGGSASGAGGVTGGQRVPAGSKLPNCTAGAVQLTLHNPKNSYPPGEKLKFDLIAKNTSGTACKVDFGPKATVLTVTSTTDDHVVWSSKDCPKDGASLLLQVPANSTIKHTVEWDREKSAPKCTKPGPQKAGSGTYLVEAKAPGMPLKQTSVVLTKD